LEQDFYNEIAIATYFGSLEVVEFLASFEGINIDQPNNAS